MQHFSIFQFGDLLMIYMSVMCNFGRLVIEDLIFMDILWLVWQIYLIKVNYSEPPPRKKNKNKNIKSTSHNSHILHLHHIKILIVESYSSIIIWKQTFSILFYYNNFLKPFYRKFDPINFKNISCIKNTLWSDGVLPTKIITGICLYKRLTWYNKGRNIS